MKQNLEVVILTGMAGAGRSTAAHALEDLGFLVIDNLPPQLMQQTIELVGSDKDLERIAIVVDSRGGKFFESLDAELARINELVAKLDLVFLEATDHVLIRRFESSRRPHPLQGTGTLAVAVTAERKLLLGLREKADLTIDTSERNVHDLRRVIEAAFNKDDVKLRVNIVSFGFKYGLPIDADFVADVRFLPNPFWEDGLRNLTGTDAPVNDFVMNQPAAAVFLSDFSKLLRNVTDGYLQEGKRFVTVAIGCTGGQHRSVAISENLSARLVKEGVECYVSHRDKGRE
ncbi:MAG: hypothetical protein RLZZ330_520 [Actinomycetota bacterium]|jgi:UPF0042 nucleotide-binding protein